MPKNNSNNTAGLTSLLIKVGLGIGVLIFGIWMVSNMVVTVGGDEVVVKQDVLDGKLHVWDTPGPRLLMFGSITRYKRSAQLWFSAKTDEGKETDDSIKVRFSDGGHGNISGSLRYTLPSDQNKMLQLHMNYHSMAAIDHELIRQVVNKSVYMSGPLMSSRESYAEKKMDLINYITDQILYGVYRTTHEEAKVVDPLTGQEKVVDVVKPKVGSGPNGIEREEDSPVQRYGMNVSNITINDLTYDPVVEEQIKKQQEAYMAVQQAIVNAKKAEQDTLTVEQQGKAEAAKAKWAQEVEKATAVTSAEKDKAVAVTQAQKDKEVAQLALDTAKIAAEQKMTEAKADANARRMALASDNLVEKRLDVYLAVQQAWASAFGAQRQTPDTVLYTPSGTGGASSAVSSMMDMVGVRAAQQLGVKP